MCGISGIFVRDPSAVPPDALQRMCDIQRHRGPDARGAVVVRDGKPVRGEECWEATPGQWRANDVGLGHVRLSILDLSDAGTQPMSLESCGLCVTYNGEIYNYLELRKELVGLGHKFGTGTDTEVLLHAYQEWGKDCLDRFNGMWSFALWDSRCNELFCAVDRSSIKPFHFVDVKHAFAFASEPKALLELPFLDRGLNCDRVALYLLSGIDNVTDNTFFRTIQRLPPGHAISLRRGAPLKQYRWWFPRIAEIREPSEAAHARELRHLVRDSIRLRYRSDVPVGIALSGGVDSSSIVCMARDMALNGELDLPHGLRTYTAGADDPTIDERKVAASIAHLAGATSYVTNPCPKEFLNDIERLVWLQDEPFATLSVYMQYCVMRKAQETGTVVLLSGQGPDELFLGYDWHFPIPLIDLVASSQLGAAVKLLAKFVTNQGIRVSTVAARAADLLIPALRASRYRLRMRSVLGPQSRGRGPDATVRAALPGCTGDTMLRHELETSGLPGLLRYEDRNSMGFSIESRLPYLDHRIVELAYSLPSWKRMAGGWSKGLLRQAMSGVTPDEVLFKRRKIGFAPPTSSFLRALDPMIQDVFSSKALSAPFLRSDTVRKASAGKALMPWLWRTLNLELWMRAFRLTC